MEWPGLLGAHILIPVHPVSTPYFRVFVNGPWRSRGVQRSWSTFSTVSGGCQVIRPWSVGLGPTRGVPLLSMSHCGDTCERTELLRAAGLGALSVDQGHVQIT